MENVEREKGDGKCLVERKVKIYKIDGFDINLTVDGSVIMYLFFFIL